MDVIVVGAGPAGLMLAHELALGGAEVVVVERLTERVEQTKGGAIQPRTAELLDARGLLDPIMERVHARPVIGGHFAGLPVELDCTPWNTRNPYPIGIPQWRIEEVLEEAATARGARVLRGHEVTAVAQDANGVTVSAGTEFRAKYLVACDGAHSTVRKLLDLPFPGRSGTFKAVLVDVRLSSVSDLVPKAAGHMSALTREVENHWGMLVPIGGDKYRFTFGKLDEPETPETDDAVRQALVALYGETTTLAEVLTRSRFGDSTRQLEQYRHGRVLFAGDAAHVHSPLGGQGLNLGVQDAINLGWKLAATVAGWAPEGLLDSYHAERHPKAARVLHHTSAQRVLATPKPSEDVRALREIFTDLLSLPDTNRTIAGMMSGLDDETRVQDFDLVTADGPTRPAELLRSGRGVLVDLTGSVRLPEEWVDRVDLVHGKASQDFDAILLRPDGAVCWRGEGPLEPALRATFG
ncbi:FAD-dependent monooxygenase [Allokutzneria sp. A3M-2-11 16]|uniref:FAD-dependent monooxygenase n=1 Tax=Allokutzneria sp. A3M-2-11 16 TaxID=2962043 RepID=UPI0020B6AE00|nr:FAD-dependent monooxygenase [Allokutzneria sp. A3M-2-11 16]MCP3802612.1 FAD-dependent monooxygenase [Allokutzneria sp. A3M-2-11 16]